ncbi:hypothetical protein PBY51_004331 [Eleginops maclovinus]|uniref:Ubiquitin-like domain-containing protein n=1 Tax=Eleginops maclovinus TaxID=56733 RepID=A0AAN8AX35_ELEMC|nr:hypothetical protein PBY51_004331 [Eleginops maclovinus]
MELIISMLNGSSHTMNVHPQDTVGSLKILIQQKLGFPFLWSALRGQGVPTVGPEAAPIQVFLKNEKGVSTTYDIKPDETVSHFKSKVEARERVPVSQQRLIHESREMNEGKLSDYNVTANSTIFLNLRLRGG